jgi:hypothetical protein
VSLSRCIGWGYEKILWGFQENFVLMSNLRLKMTLRLDSGMISSVGIWPLRKPFQFSLVLLGQRIYLLQLMWNFLEVSFSGM